MHLERFIFSKKTGYLLGVINIMSELKILLAEDEFLCFEALKSNIEKIGHKVISEAHDGRAAVDKAFEFNPDLIIIDINMPKMNGLNAIKTINQKKDIPSIIVTGYCDDDFLDEAKEINAFGYLVKPVGFRDLKGAIEIAMAKFQCFKRINEELKNTKKSLEARKYIEKAKGILMDKNNLKEAEAMKKLQDMSKNRNEKLIKIAKKIIEAKEIFDDSSATSC